MGLFDTHEWVYWFHMTVGTLLLGLIPLLIFFKGEKWVGETTIEAWHNLLIAVALGMFGYHFFKLLKFKGIIKGDTK